MQSKLDVSISKIIFGITNEPNTYNTIPIKFCKY